MDGRQPPQLPALMAMDHTLDHALRLAENQRDPAEAEGGLLSGRAPGLSAAWGRPPRSTS